MSSEEQADAYLGEADLTLTSARAIYRSATDDQENLWAQVVKNGYDAIEQAVSAGIAAQTESIPRAHPAKIDTFLDLYQPPEEFEDILLYWLGRRSDSQYVDIRGDTINIPHEQFDQEDADRILADARTVIKHVEEVIR